MPIDPKAPAATPDYSSAVGKTFAIKDAAGSAADRRFQVVKFIPALDFGRRRKGKRPAFDVHRLIDGQAVSAHTPPADEFLAGHVEVPS